MQKKFRLFTLLAFLVMIPIVLAGCSNTPKVKIFAKDGMTITANTSFTQKEILTHNIMLESKTIIITGLREMPVPQFPISKTLTQYTDLTLQVNSLDATSAIVHDEDGVVFHRFTYEREVAGKNFMYMGVTKKGENAFYLFNFGCTKKNWDKNYTKFIDWAKLLIVE